jgi:hypothetical protein
MPPVIVDFFWSRIFRMKGGRYENINEKGKWKWFGNQNS